MLCASQGYLERSGVPVAGNLAGHELLVLEGPLGRIPAMGWLLSQIYEVRVALRASDLEPLVSAARAGAGIACLPAVLVTAGSSLVPIAPGIVGRCDMFVATHRDLRNRARVRAVFDFLVRLIGSHTAELSGAKIPSLLDGPVEA